MESCKSEKLNAVLMKHHEAMLLKDIDAVGGGQADPQAPLVAVASSQDQPPAPPAASRTRPDTCARAASGRDQV